MDSELYRRVDEWANHKMKSINHNEYQEILRNKMTQWFFTEVHLLTNKLVPVVAIHSIRGSRAYRHHTPNPQPGAAQPTQYEDPQATRNPLELPLALHRGRHKNPSQS